jgi:hypothetical protein
VDPEEAKRPKSLKYDDDDDDYIPRTDGKNACVETNSKLIPTLFVFLFGPLIVIQWLAFAFGRMVKLGRNILEP